MVQARQPVDLILLKGRTHLTKKEIQERREQEIKAPKDNVKYPKYLPKELRTEYNKISKTLVEIGIMTNLDTDALARFLITREQYVKVMEVLRSVDPEEDIVYYTKVLTAYDKLFQELNRASQELGLSVNARGKLLVPKVKKPKTEEETKTEYAERRFGV